MKKYLIAGGAGFVGSHLCDRLLTDNNNYVICLDNLFTGHKRNIEHNINNANFKFVKHDVKNPFLEHVDEIYNLACPASPIHYQTSPIETTMVSVLGTYNLLELARKTGAKYLQASTSEVYGNPAIHPQKESYLGNVNANGVRACYDEGKRCAESLCFDYHRQYGMNIKVIRIFNTYGPRMHPNDGRVISNMIVQAINNENITVFGDGTQTRSFQYVDDLIEGFIRVMLTDSSFIGPLNIGNPYEISINKLAEIIKEKTNPLSPIIYKKLPEDDPQRRCPDISQAHIVLNGWKPQINFTDGLEKTIDYFYSIMERKQSCVI